MPRCKAPEILRPKGMSIEAYLAEVRRKDEGLGKRSRWAFFSSLIVTAVSICRFNPSFLLEFQGSPNSLG